MVCSLIVTTTVQCNLTHARTHTLSLSHSLTHTHTHTHTFSLSHARAPTHSLLRTHTLSLTCTHLSLELLHYVSEKMLVEIFSAQERVSIGGFDLENTLLDLQDRDIERPAAQIIHRNSTETTGTLLNEVRYQDAVS